MHTFFLENIPEVDSEVALSRREHDHLFKTLRCRAGELLKLCDGQGTIATAEATEQRTVKVLTRATAQMDRIRVHLFVALPRNSKLDLLIKPATEAGVYSITPLKCRYSVAEKSSIPERWYTLMEEACKQSGNPFLPQINLPQTVQEALQSCQQKNYQIFYGDQHGLPLRTEDFSSCGQLDLAWMVGPEGGFDEKELDLLSNAGRGITLGKYIFRLENAALAGIAHLYSTAYAAAAR